MGVSSEAVVGPDAGSVLPDAPRAHRARRLLATIVFLAGIWILAVAVAGTARADPAAAAGDHPAVGTDTVLPVDETAPEDALIPPVPDDGGLTDGDDIGDDVSIGDDGTTTDDPDDAYEGNKDRQTTEPADDTGTGPTEESVDTAPGPADATTTESPLPGDLLPTDDPSQVDASVVVDPLEPVATPVDELLTESALTSEPPTVEEAKQPPVPASVPTADTTVCSEDAPPVVAAASPGLVLRPAAVAATPEPVSAVGLGSSSPTQGSTPLNSSPPAAPAGLPVPPQAPSPGGTTATATASSAACGSAQGDRHTLLTAVLAAGLPAVLAHAGVGYAGGPDGTPVPGDDAPGDRPD